MPSVLQAPLNLSVGFMLKEKAPEPILSAFTAVNGRASPPSPPTSNSTNGMTNDSFHVRPVSRNTAEPVQEHQDSLPRRDGWRGVGLPPLGPHGLPLTNGQTNGHPNGHYSPSTSPVDNGSPNSPGKRKRSSSAEGANSPLSQDGAVRRRLDSYASVVTNGSPVSQGQPGSMDHSQQQPLPPIDRVEHERAWQSRELQDGGHGSYPDQQPRDPRNGEAPQDSMNPNSATVPQPMGTGDSQIPIERSSTLEITRAGVLVDPKKRKRQFANRTKTGCGTCRRRKKKCDEAKPECNNCLRGSFICEGYANKVPWPKNNPNKHQPLQSKDQFPINPPQLYHNHGTNREGYPSDPNGHTPVDGAQARPIVVDEHDRQPAGRNGWGNWAEPARGNYPADHHRPAEFSHPPSMQQQPQQPPQPQPQPQQQPPPPPPPQQQQQQQQQQQPLARPPSNDHHAPHPTQGPPPPPRQHNPRIYHHTQQTMSQNVKSSPAATAEAALQHQSQQQQQPHQQQPQMHPAQPHTNGPQGPPPPHYQHPPPPKPEKTEKDKMLSGEPFQPYNHQLCEDRERARQLCYRYNQTTNQYVEIGREEVGRICRAIFGANYRTNPRNPNQMQGYLGREVQVDTPFYCDYGYNIFINDRVAIEANCKFLDSGKITIGQNCTIEANVTISTKKVPNDIKAMKGTRGSAIAADVVIGDNVWIGANSTIHAGVKIGTGAIIYPGSVVTRDIPRDVAVRGNPAEIHMVGWDEH